MVFEISDLLFFIRSYQSPTSAFNIMNYISFSSSSTRSGYNFKLRHTISQNNSVRHFYFNRLPRLWNSLPPLDPNLPFPALLSKINSIFWNHFISTFNPHITCTYHYMCPCSKCLLSAPVSNLSPS